MSDFSDREKIELNKVLSSIEGRLDKKLIRLTMDVVMKTNWSQEIERDLYKKNVDNIPEKSVEAALFGSHIGQIYQVSLDFATKMKLELKPVQKTILKEFIFFLVSLRTDKEKKRTS